MGTGSHERINMRITGNIAFDYQDKNYAPDLFKDELRTLCIKYGLDYGEIEEREY